MPHSTMRDNAPWLRKCALCLQSGQRQRPTRRCGPDGDAAGFPWLAVQLRCAECWLWGQNIGRIDGDVAMKGISNALRRPGGSGFGRLTTNGVLVNALRVRTSLKATARQSTDASVSWRLHAGEDSPFDIDYDLIGARPRNRCRVARSASLKATCGRFTRPGPGTRATAASAGVDALLRKLHSISAIPSAKAFASIQLTVPASTRIAYSVDDALVDRLEADLL